MRNVKTALPFVLLASSLLAMNAQAEETSIIINADVGSTLALRAPDGSEIGPQKMNYTPGKGLQDLNIDTKIFSNDISKNVKMSLSSDAKLTNAVDSSTVPLTVSFDGAVVNSTTPTVITTANIIWDSNGGSQTKILKIAPTTRGVLSTSGTYTGTIGIILAQAAP